MVHDKLLFPFLKEADSDLEYEKFRTGLIGSSIHSVSRYGKFFWLRLKKHDCKETNVLLIHLGMTGMVKLKNIKSHLTFMENGGDRKILEKLKKEHVPKEESKLKKEAIKEELDAGPESQTFGDWPPKFCKFELTFEKDGKTIDFAFVDPRRFARIRYLPGDLVPTNNDLLNHPQLTSFRGDYSKPITPPEPKKHFVFGDPDPDNHGHPIPSLQEFNKLILSKKKSIKALLLEQKYFAGVGNWISDEILYQARIHPEDVLLTKFELSNDVHEVIEKLYNTIIYVCKKSVEVEGDVTQYPEDWLMLYRWGKGRKTEATIKSGHKVKFITAGGRTCCFVPDLQKPLPSINKRSNNGNGKTDKRQKK